MSDLSSTDRVHAHLGKRGAFEGVARRHGRRRNPARRPPPSSLRTLTNQPRHSTQRWVEKCDRSVANSETPHRHRQRRPPRPTTTHPTRLQPHPRRQFLDPPPDRVLRYTRRARDRSNPTTPMRPSLRRRPQPTLTLVQLRTQPRKTLRNLRFIDHALAIRQPPPTSSHTALNHSRRLNRRSGPGQKRSSSARSWFTNAVLAPTRSSRPRVSALIAFVASESGSSTRKRS